MTTKKELAAQAKADKVARLAEEREARILSYVANLQTAWDNADATWLARGMHWYATATAELHAIADKYGVDHAIARGVCAQLSQDNVWRRNLEDYALTLAAFATTGDTTCITTGHRYAQVRDKVTAILSGMNVDRVLDNYGKGSDAYKIKRFHAIFCGQLDVVCVDRHHARICMARQGDATVGTPSGSTYLEMEEATIRFADRIGIHASGVQAGLWLDLLREKGL